MIFNINFLLSFFLLLFAAASHSGEEASPAKGTALWIEVTGLQDAKGNIYISVYDSDDSWLGEDYVHFEPVAIAEALEDGVVRVELRLSPGEYALSIYHDIDNDGELDTNFIGIPKEPVALSNNARPKFGPPKYEDAVFTLGEEAITQRIAMENI